MINTEVCLESAWGLYLPVLVTNGTLGSDFSL